MNNKYNKLLSYLRSLDSIAIAFSGGVDSSFLAKAAYEALGNKSIAITIDSPYIPNWEIEEAKELARKIGIKHVLITLDEIPSMIKENPENRCYLCKSMLFTMMIEKAKSLGFKHMADGTNFDDTSDYRPGLVALKELAVISPLLKLAWTKEEIRNQSQALGLETWDKPAYACLLTRVPYNRTLEKSELSKIEQAETYLMSQGFKGLRVRKHDNIARIEVAKDERSKFFDLKLLDKISKEIKRIGFDHVCIEAGGYAMGSMNTNITEGNNNEPK